ncbi:2'-5'-oligoadenylate synthase-like protein 2 [Octodon degus]|uniref:2'-5' oligoadenylate synthase n=1 Tax=Octodon degus TaxID=10160 RepID=A0A6P3FFL6_OCTDE|nr:2'-5'-oligoadenylate synthase-like protein 2 [Octodon degus]
MDRIPDLYATPGDRLDAFLKHSLQPQRDWKEEVEDAKQRVEKFLRNQCFRDHLVLDREVRVLKVMRGGSSGKGTMLNQTSDVDIIVFLSCFSSFQDQAILRGCVIDFIKDRLDCCSESLAYNITVVHYRQGSREPRSLTLQVQSRKSSDVIRMDVVLAFDALGNFCLDSKPAPEIYEDLINSFRHPGEFSPSFTVLQRDFVRTRPVKLKNLLQLVKYWYLKYVKSQHQRVALPSKYALELLTIYAWEAGTDQKENFELDEGLVAVMALLRDYEDICIYWTKYYDFQSEIVRNFIKQQLKKRRPIILDPSDPTNNLGKGRRWDLVAQEAAYCLRQACCLTVDPSERWHVQKARNVQVTVKQTGKEDWTLSVDPYSPIWKMKTEIKRRNSIMGKQRLSFQEAGGERLLLSSQKTLAHYGIFSKVNIRVLETSSTEIQVFVKDSSGQSRPYAINPDDTILDLKEIIEEAGGPPVEDQILKFEGRRLRDHKCLEDLEIEDCDTITLIRR